MILRKWDDLPENLKLPEVKPYYDALTRKKGSLFIKRVFDMVVSFVMLILLCWLFAIIAIIVKCDSKGEIIYKQIRVTKYGKKFNIYKFRTMETVQNKEDLHRQLTVGDDSRITRSGNFLRKFRLDELPQLVNVLKGEMSFVGTRPEVPVYVDQYTPEMMATLLLPAGVTGIASIAYKEESEELAETEDPAKHYVEEILPKKMALNLQEVKDIGPIYDIKIMLKTVAAVF